MADNLPKGRVTVRGAVRVTYLNEALWRKIAEEAAAKDAERIAFLERMSGLKVVMRDDEP
jgi:hypothetical protein